MGTRGTVYFLYSGQGFLLISTTHAREGLLLSFIILLVYVGSFETVQRRQKEVTVETSTSPRRMARTSKIVGIDNSVFRKI